MSQASRRQYAWESARARIRQLEAQVRHLREAVSDIPRLESQLCEAKVRIGVLQSDCSRLRGENRVLKGVNRDYEQSTSASDLGWNSGSVAYF